MDVAQDDFPLLYGACFLLFARRPYYLTSAAQRAFTILCLAKWLMAPPLSTQLQAPSQDADAPTGVRFNPKTDRRRLAHSSVMT